MDFDKEELALLSLGVAVVACKVRDRLEEAEREYRQRFPKDPGLAAHVEMASRDLDAANALHAKLNSIAFPPA